MKRIILGLSVLLMLAQNGFAKTDAEYDKLIANETDKVWKQLYRCAKEAINHSESGDVDACIKANKLVLNGKVYNIYVAGTYLNIGSLYYESKGDKLKAYKYYMKAAKLGNIKAQKNLSIMCKQDPWACQ